MVLPKQNFNGLESANYEVSRRLAGIDLAWRSAKNSTAVAVGLLDCRQLRVSDIATGLIGTEAVFDCLNSFQNLAGISIDGPLIITNDTGQRQCERLLSREYGSRGASCHSSNLSLYKDADSVRLSERLSDLGFKHLGNRAGRWQIECYPHPALVEIFDLRSRQSYKKGSVDAKRSGQCALAELLLSLQKSEVLSLTIPSALAQPLICDHICNLKGTALKRNEDALDAIICLYVAGLYALSVEAHTFGNVQDGYIYVPRKRCV